MSRRLASTFTPNGAQGYPLLPDAASDAGSGSGVATVDTGADGGKAPEFQGDFDPERYQRLVANLRGDVESEQAKRKALQDQFDTLRDTLAQVFNLQAASGPQGGSQGQRKGEGPDTEALRTRAQEAARQLAVYRAAVKAGADPDALADSVSFMAQVGNLDPDSKTFVANVDQAVSAAIEANPRLKAAKGEQGDAAPKPKAGRSGGEFNGGSGEARQITEAELQRMTPDQIAEAFQQGLLKDLM